MDYENVLKYNEKLNKDLNQIKDNRPKTAFIKNSNEDKSLYFYSGTM